MLCKVMIIMTGTLSESKETALSQDSLFKNVMDISLLFHFIGAFSYVESIIINFYVVQTFG